MKQIQVIGCCILSLTLILSGCSTVNQEIRDRQAIQTLEEVEFSELKKYKDTYVGNNSAVSAIIKALPYNAYVDWFELKTTEPPYEVIVHYDNYKDKDPLVAADSYGDSTQTLFLNHAKVMFALISNVDIMTFQIGDDEVFKYSRTEIETEEGKPLNHILQNEEEWDLFISQIYKTS